MRLDLERVRANIRAADTDDLLDRATVYRAGMEAEALELIEDELRRRGVSAAAQVDHAEQRRQALAQGGVALRCARCRRPAVWCGWRWHWLWGLVPLFPRRFALCEEHHIRNDEISKR